MRDCFFSSAGRWQTCGDECRTWMRSLVHVSGVFTVLQPSSLHRETADFRRSRRFFSPTAASLGLLSPTPVCWTRIATVRSHLNAVSDSNRDVLYDPPAVHRLPGLLNDEWSCRQRLASLFWIILHYRVFPASEIHPPVLFLPSLSLFLFFFFLGRREQIEGLGKIKYSPHPAENRCQCALERWQQW